MARKTKKQMLAEEIIKRLKEEYPDAECSLEYDEAWKLLVSVRLAAQCLHNIRELCFPIYLSFLKST